MKLDEYYKTHNIKQMDEGYSQEIEGQTNFLKNILQKHNVKRVMEIGFNGGHSAELFLSNNTSIELVSFDIGCHDYVSLGKNFIDKTYPGRHELIIGDSLKTVPKYDKTKGLFDIIFIDGGHKYPISKGDLMNCKRLSHTNTIVIMDDTMNTKKWIKPWNTGPTRSWNEAIQEGSIEAMGSEDYKVGRGQSWGKYII